MFIKLGSGKAVKRRPRRKCAGVRTPEQLHIVFFDIAYFQVFKQTGDVYATGFGSS